MKIGCHAVLFGGKIAEDPTAVVKALKSTGADGIEIGVRFFGLGNSQRLRQIMDEAGLELSGMHVGIQLAQVLDDPDISWGQLEEAAKFLQAMPCKNIIMTGGLAQDAMALPNLGDDRLCDPEQLKLVAARLNEFAKRVRSEYGVTLHYHNHDWEFRNDAVLFKALEQDAPDLFFALDIGWAAVGGYDPLETVTKHAKRIGYLHLRDYSLSVGKDFNERRQSFLPIGQGDANYPALLPALNKLLNKDAWAIVEYETGEVDEVRYTQALQYLRSIN